jgi:hypothetical protein
MTVSTAKIVLRFEVRDQAGTGLLAIIQVSPVSNIILLLLEATDLKRYLHKHDIFFIFFCRNRNLMVPRAYNTRLLKLVFDSAEIFDF